MTLVFIPPDQVESIQAPSTRILTLRVLRLWPEINATAYLVVVGDYRPKAYVFGRVRMEGLMRQAAKRGFSVSAVEEVFLSGKTAVQARADSRPWAPGYVPNDGGLWVPREELGVELRRVHPAPHRRRARHLREMHNKLVHRGLEWTQEQLSQYAQRVIRPLPRHRARMPREERTLRRTPHLELSESLPLAPAARFDVIVWCDDRPAEPGQEVTPVELELAPGIDEALVEVWIAASGHFEIHERTGWLLLRRMDAASKRLRFGASVVEHPPPGQGSITAVFTYEGRTRGQVTAVVPISTPAAAASSPAGEAPARRGDEPPESPTGNATPATPPPADGPTGGGEPGGGAPPPRGPRVKITAGDRRPDITVEVIATGRAEYTASVTSRVVPGFEYAEPEPWPLPEDTPALVAGYMKSFAALNLDTDERRSRLEGVGMKLWRVAPERFKDVYWRVADASASLGSVLVVSQEPAFPWELLVPNRGTGKDRLAHRALGVTTPVGRYIDEAMVTPEQGLALDASWVLAPTYTGGSVLKHAPAEAKFVCEHFGGELITPALYATIEAEFGRRAVPLFHLACHGQTGEGGAQSVRLEGGKQLMSEQVEAMPALSAAITDREPLIFVNACEVGRTTPDLLGVGGFAVAFLSVGARCVVAPLWKVEDRVAHAFAMEFYRRLLATPAPPPARVVRDLRARAYEDGGADSWAAYCFFGDPNAALE